MILTRLVPVLLFLALITITTTQQREGDFIIELTPAMDGKKVKPFNISIPINSSYSHILPVSSINFRKNITLGMQLYAWYNGGWIIKKSRVLQITDKKMPIDQSEKLLMKLTKARFKKSTTMKNQMLLTHGQIYISHDPEGSLMTSQLEDGSLFIPQSNYVPTQSISKDQGKVEVEIVFKVLPKTDAFIQNRRHLSELAEVRQKVEEGVALVSRQIENKNIEPTQILDWAKRNINSLAMYEKKIMEKLVMMEKYGLKNLIAPSIGKIQLETDFPSIAEYLKTKKLVYKEGAVLAYHWAFEQEAMKESIEELREKVLSNVQELTSRDFIKELSANTQKQQQISYFIGVLWVLLDVVSYLFIRRNLGLSKSYGIFLNIWILTQIIAWSVRIGIALQSYAGFIVFLSAILIHWIVVYLFQRRIDSSLHEGSNFDYKVTSLMKNMLVLVIMFNIFSHCLMGSGINFESFKAEGFQVLRKAKGSISVLTFWIFSQFIVLLQEYFYFLVMVPQILLNFRLKNVEKGAIARIIMLLALGWIQIQNCSLNEVDLALGLKEGILGVVLLIQFILFRKNQSVKPLLIPLERQSFEKSEKDESEMTKEESSSSQLKKDSAK